MKSEHRAVGFLLHDTRAESQISDFEEWGSGAATSLSLARALAVGALSRLNQGLRRVDVWDPVSGGGSLACLVVEALRAADVNVRYRGHDISTAAVERARSRFDSTSDVEFAVADTLVRDAYEGFRADLVLVDAPWGLSWKGEERAVVARHQQGELGFGLPAQSDASWLFISLALEKLRGPEDGGGRVAALVAPSALSSRRSSAVRESILNAGLLESVTRLPDRLAPNTDVAPYLMTFSNEPTSTRRGSTMVFDLQTQFTTERGRRQIPIGAVREFDSGLRTRKPGPRNRTVGNNEFIRRDAELVRVSSEGATLSWGVTSHRDAPIDEEYLVRRYGENSGVEVSTPAQTTIDLDPSIFFNDEESRLQKAIKEMGWPSTRLITLLTHAPERVDADGDLRDGHLFVPTGAGPVSVDVAPSGVSGRVLVVGVEKSYVHSAFLAAWLNSAQGAVSRRRALDSGASGAFLRVVRSDARSLMRWADELLVPVPSFSSQIELASADERLRSFQAELDTHRAQIWATPDLASEVVSRFERVFDDSNAAWLENLPYPLASALWTAETASPAGEKQRAYLHAWEGIATFHATVLLSACRTDPGLGEEVEQSIRQTLKEAGLSIERASFKTWIIIVEKAARELRKLLDNGDSDDVARVQRAFAGLGRTWIERLVAQDVVRKFNDVNTKRNLWLGHSGHVPEEERQHQVDELVADLRDLKATLGDVWRRLPLVRAGSNRRTRESWEQQVEIAMGTRIPFATETFTVGDAMIDGELYLARDGSESPLRLGAFVQLRAAPSSAHFTSYFYNRTEGTRVRMVSYQHGPDNEVSDDMESFREQFGALVAD